MSYLEGRFQRIRLQSKHHNLNIHWMGWDFTWCPPGIYSWAYTFLDLY
jgi:hypothetical protein